MADLIDVARQFLTDDGWPLAEVPEKPILRTGFEGKNGAWNVFIQADEAHRLLLIYSVCPFKVSEDQRPAVVEYVTRANYGLLLGNFEFDYTDGEVRFKTSIDVESAELTPALVHNLAYANVYMMDRYLPGIMMVVYGKAQPADAIREVEG